MIKQRRYLKKDERIFLGIYSTYTKLGHFSVTFFETENDIRYQINPDSIPSVKFRLDDLNFAVESAKVKEAIRVIINAHFSDKASLEDYLKNTLLKSGNYLVIEERFMTSGFPWKIDGYDDGKAKLWCKAFPSKSLPIEFTYKILCEYLREWVEGIIEDHPEWKDFKSRTIADDHCLN